MAICEVIGAGQPSLGEVAGCTRSATIMTSLAGTWVVHTVQVEDPGDLLAQLPDAPPVVWLHQGEGLLGWGEAARIEPGPGPGRFARAEEALGQLFDAADVQDEVKLPGTGPVGFGSFTFDPRSAGSVVVVPRVLLGRRYGTAWLTTVGREPVRLYSARPGSAGPIRWLGGALPPDGYMRATSAAMAEIGAGRVAKVVLSRDLRGVARQPIDPRALLGRLARRFPTCYTFSCGGLVGATPELLVRRRGDRIHSLVLAGSTVRGPDPASDVALAAALRASDKGAVEHRLAVASVRDRLAELCAELAIPDVPSLLVLANIQHLATPIHGRLAYRDSALTLAAALHPTAAVCGVPAGPALDLIRTLEGADRGRYTGPVGWIDRNGDGEWGIALRCAELAGRRIRLFAGAGIVAGSDPPAELAETTAKMAAILDVLTGI